jgi:hypothetical protein
MNKALEWVHISFLSGVFLGNERYYPLSIDLLETEVSTAISVPASTNDIQATPWLFPQDSLEDPGVLTGACFGLMKVSGTLQ